ncbi:hypothetical protein GCM10011316_09140 [Roseibium aquae]|uniref:Phosphonate metabolism protein n=1 Tax=Roseibium aquae TaxID=1323746 RepID=A0A916TBU0_9HYPH|nr:DUF1045 domain-containing protein [Roseibium aquae]GGB39269.1 hypothetical protein GCM10011316_09140 [Roseibium aquae]
MRYAIYFAAPANDPLMELGSLWLGRDPFTGLPVIQPHVPGVSAQRLAELTADPRRYGFHGTLKAPFSLKQGVLEDDLLAECARFGSHVAPFGIPGLEVTRLGRFLALTPSEEAPELPALAALCVKTFEPFRAPLPESDLARRRAAGLTRVQDNNLVHWGYPYVFGDFRFHMTLTNKLVDDNEALYLERAAQSHFQEMTGRPITCTAFGLYVEPERGAPFEVHSMFDLTGETRPSEAAARLKEVQ